MTENYHGVSVRSETTMTDDLKARLDALHVWPQAVADAYAAELTPRQIDKLYAVGKVATEAAEHIATLEAALADMTQQRDAAMAGAVKPDMDVIDRSDIDRLILVLRRRHGSDIDHQAADLILSLTEALAEARILSAMTPDPSTLSRIEAQAEARGMRRAAWSFDDDTKPQAARSGILALADATEAAAKGDNNG